MSLLLHESAVKRLRKVFGYASGGLTITAAEARECLGILSPRKASPKAKATRARKRATSAAEDRRNEVSDEALRRAVAMRAGGDCELEWDYGHVGHEPHHLLSGSAKRIDEKPENVMWVCRVHHDAYHRRPSKFIHDVQAWAERNKLPVPARILRLERRLASPPAPQAPGAVSGGEK